MKKKLEFASIVIGLSLMACSGSDPIHYDIACVDKQVDGAPITCIEESGRDFSDKNCTDRLDSTDKADGVTSSAATSCPSGSKYDCNIMASDSVTRHTYFYGVLGGLRGAVACGIENIAN